MSERVVIQAGIEDAGHFSPEDRARIIASYPSHERDARTKGIPQLGSGAVFPVDEDDIRCEPFSIPPHWTQIAGIDFGYYHPSAAARLAWDKDTDCIYITQGYRKAKQSPMMFSGAVRQWGDWLPWAWPHDGKASGGKFDVKDQKQLQAIYAGHGLKMLPLHATFEDGTNGVEAGIQDMLDRMYTGRWKVFRTVTEYFEEMRTYHRKDGLIVKEHDDLISASRYAYMMRRFAIVQNKPAVTNKFQVPGRPQSWMGVT